MKQDAMPVFRIETIAHELGSQRLAVADLFADAGDLIARTEVPYVWESSTSAVHLGREAAIKALSRTPGGSGGVGAIFYVTQSPSNYLPAHACQLQHALGLSTSTLALDINQGCSGFVQALVVAVRMLPVFRRILIVTADTYRAKLDPTDRSTGAIFSDGACATILTDEAPTHRLGAEAHFTDGSGESALYQRAEPTNTYLKMQGRDVYLFTKRVVLDQIREAVSSSSISMSEIDMCFLHQASGLVLSNLRKELETSGVAVPTNLGRFGNTVSSSIPLLLEDSLDSLAGLNYVASGFGVGLSASTLVAEALDA